VRRFNQLRANSLSTGLVALIAGNDDAGLLTAARLFPIRTGVPVSFVPLALLTSRYQIGRWSDLECHGRLQGD
jgi:hypothetical protein